MLKVNGARLHTHVNRAFGGNGVAGIYGLGMSALGANFTRANGCMQNFPAGWHTVANVTDRAGRPSGQRGAAAWVMARKAGGIASRNEAIASLSGTGAGALGRNLATLAALELAASASGQLVVSGLGSASFSITASGNTVASLAAAGSAGLALAGSGTAGALAWGAASATVSVTAALTPYAIGHMAGEVTPYTELSPQSLAAAVWAQAIEAGYTAEQILRGLAAVNLGAATGLDGANPQFVGLDGATTRVDGSQASGNRTIDSLNLD